MNKRISRYIVFPAMLAAVGGLSGVAAAAGTPVDLGPWSSESYPAVSGFPAGDWVVASDALSVTQTKNGQPTFFFSDFGAFDTAFEGQIRVNSDNDDDFVGFALGFQPGDSTNAAADYLLVDWKRGDQPYNFGAPSCTPGSVAPRGLAVSRVTGVPTADEFWGHTDLGDCDSQVGFVEELARATTLGSTGWEVGQEYTFGFEFDATTLSVFVDGTQELSVTGSFANGRIAFYNFSQADVTYSGFELTKLVDIDIKPGSDPNCFNSDGHGAIPVAILSTSDFDATQVDPTTAQLDGQTVRSVGKGNLQAHVEDVNGDGLLDLMLQFEDLDGTYTPGSGIAVVTALTFDGLAIEGQDSICVVPA